MHRDWRRLIGLTALDLFFRFRQEVRHQSFRRNKMMHQPIVPGAGDGMGIVKDS